MNYLNQNQNQLNTNGSTVRYRLSFYSTYAAVICYMIVAFISLASCSSDDSTDTPDVEIIQPTITLQSGSTDVFEGVIGSPTSGTLDYTIIANTPNGFSQMIIEKIVEGNVTTFEIIHEDHPDYVENAPSFSYILNHILTEGNANSTISFKATVTDSNGNAAILNFASATVKRPLKKEYLTLRIDNLVSGLPTLPNFMYANEDELKEETIQGVVNNNADQNIFAVLSKNDDLGLYLASPFATMEDQLTNQFTDINSTKFKKHSFTTNQFNNYLIYDVYEIEDLYEAVDFNAYEERAENITSGSIYSFLTEDLRVGLILIKDIETINQGDDYYVDLDVFITQ